MNVSVLMDRMIAAGGWRKGPGDPEFAVTRVAHESPTGKQIVTLSFDAIGRTQRVLRTIMVSFDDEWFVEYALDDAKRPVCTMARYDGTTFVPCVEIHRPSAMPVAQWNYFVGSRRFFSSFIRQFHSFPSVTMVRL